MSEYVNNKSYFNFVTLGSLEHHKPQKIFKKRKKTFTEALNTNFLKNKSYNKH